MSYAVVVTTVTDEVDGPTETESCVHARGGAGSHATGARYDDRRRCRHGRSMTAPALAVGLRIAGPAIVAEDETSTLIGPGWQAMVNGLGYLALERSG